MHQSSYSIITRFRDLVEKHFQNDKIRILDVGSYGVNGTYKEIFSDSAKYDYVGLDVNPGPNVDYVPTDPYSWPELKDETFDVIISGQAFEHIEFPWLVIEEMKRTLKKNGLICIVAPSRGPEHKYPVDCWRYYPDGFRALAKWAGLEVLDAKTIWGASGFTDGSDQWGDSFCILWKDGAQSPAKNIEHLTLKARSDLNKNNPMESGKTASYYSFARGEIIDAIVKNGLPAKRVLEIGCAGGATGKKLKETLPVDYYVGVEISEHAAVIARQHLDRVIVADIEKTDLVDCGLKHGDFDLLLVLDVLEHLYNPWDVLAGLKRFLKPGGHVIASIPNIQNITIVSSLVHGRWRYESAGILDATHVRFFTMEEIERLFSGADLPITKTEYVLNPPVDVSKIKDSGNNLTHENISLANLSREEVLRLFIYQYFVIAKNDIAVPSCQGSDHANGRLSAPPAKQETKSVAGTATTPQPLLEIKEPVSGLVSVVILTFNQLKYTKECVESIRKHTPEQHEIIFVDNGSTDGTVKWLRRFAEENKKYKVIENPENYGFAKGCNQGMEASRGEYILLLNNDVVVNEGWLSGMLECINSASDIGIVGPMTNNISGPQKVQNAAYRTMSQMHDFAAEFRKLYRNRRIPIRRIVGFCMLFRRDLAEKMGLLDESFGTGNFEDDDYCLRSSLAGYRNIIAGDVFIHHYGSRSFIGNRIDYGSAISGNRKVFNEKWSGINAQSDLGKKLLITSTFENAEELSQKGEIDKAVEKLIEGIGYSPDSKEIYQTLAQILIDAKRFKDALDAINSMPEETKKDIKSLELIGYCKEGLELYKEAEEYADKALSMNSTRAPALNLKGILAYRQGARKTAEELFKKALASDPGYGEPYTNLGVLSWTEGNKDEALNMLERGFILSPASLDIATTYHSAITGMNAFGRAERAFHEAKALYPLNRRIAFLLIDVLLQQGKNEEAMQEIEEAINSFGIDDDLLSAALAVRDKVGSKEINRTLKNRGTLSLCMIVKNEEQHIAKCLMSVKPVVDEMIVVDTGSTDRTKELAKALGAKVYAFEWAGDFSAARNYSLSKASGKWILVLDADEVISPADYAALSNIVKKDNPKTIAYKIVTRNYSNQVGAEGWTANKGEYPNEEAAIGWFPSEKVRLFINDDRIRFENPVHEFVEGSVQKAGMAIKPCSIPVHHYGRLNMEKLAAKGEAYYMLGKKKLEGKKNDLKALFELGVQAAELKRFEEAAELLQKVVDIDPKYPNALFNLGFDYMELGRYDEAFIFCRKAFELNPGHKESAINYAHCEIVAGDIKNARSLLEGTVRTAPDYPPAMAALAAAYYIEGRKEEGLRIIEELQQKGFDCSNALYYIAKGLFLTGRFKEAITLIEAAVYSKDIHTDTDDLLHKCYRAIINGERNPDSK